MYEEERRKADQIGQEAEAQGEALETLRDEWRALERRLEALENEVRKLRDSVESKGVGSGGARVSNTGT
jgi:hypothetical protein